MSGFYGNVALLLPGKLEEQAAVAGLRRAAQALDEAFIEIPEWIENRPPVPERIIGVQPDGSPWMTCLDPICNEGLESDIALDVAQLYGQAFGAPALSFSVADGGQLLVMGCAIPGRPRCWTARGSLASLLFYEIDLAVCRFPREASRLMKPENRFAFNRLWMQRPDGREEKRMEEIADLFGFCILGNLPYQEGPSQAAVIDLPFRPFSPNR